MSDTAVTTDMVRFSYTHLFAPRANKPGDEPKYGTTILIPKTDVATLQRIQRAIEAAIQAGIAKTWRGSRPAVLDLPIRDGDGPRRNGQPYSPECRGHWVINSSSKQKQAIVDANLNPIIDQSQVYSGMYGRVNLNFFAYLNSGNAGIGAGLGPVQKVSDGEPLAGSAVSAEQAFGGTPAPQAPMPGYGQAPGFGQPQYPPQAYGQVPQQAPAYPAQPVYVQAPQQPPAAPQQPGYAPTPGYSPAPAYGQPQQAPGYGQTPGYGQAPAYPSHPPGYGQPPAAPQQQQLDPITGKPSNGGIFGL